MIAIRWGHPMFAFPKVLSDIAMSEAMSSQVWPLARHHPRPKIKNHSEGEFGCNGAGTSAFPTVHPRIRCDMQQPKHTHLL